MNRRYLDKWENSVLDSTEETEAMVEVHAKGETRGIMRGQVEL